MTPLAAILGAAPPADGEAAAGALDRAGEIVGVLNGTAHVFVVAFLVTLVATPFARRIAWDRGIVDRPSEARKVHAQTIPYLGGVAVLLGLVAAVVTSWVAPGVETEYRGVPIAVVIGMLAIAGTGLGDDIFHWDPRTKIAGQLVAAAALAIEDVGTRVAVGFLQPILGHPETLLFTLAEEPFVLGDVYYWVGTFLIAAFVLGACNAANFLDGLDGLLTGTTAISAVGLLAISLVVLPTYGIGGGAEAIAALPGGELDPSNLPVARVVLCLALLGACLGFLPWNFNPAVIFLGDCGSLLLGYVTAVIILMLGDRGQTHVVVAGLIVFSLPIVDTMLAIVRRRLAGKSVTEADDQHIHHQVRRALGTVRRAVFALYGIAAAFAAVGVLMAVLVTEEFRARGVYAVAMVLFGFVSVTALKEARRQMKREAAKAAETRT